MSRRLTFKRHLVRASGHSVPPAAAIEIISLIKDIYNNIIGEK